MKRLAAVAGMFYPAAASELNALLGDWLSADSVVPQKPHALIVPHAGFIYSGAVAASAFRQLKGQHYSAVVIAGPAHRVAVNGVALSSASEFITPLGALAINQTLQQIALQFSFVQQRDDAHLLEHAIEVQLPFVQRLIPNTTILPMVVGDCAAADFCALLQALYQDDRLLIISSDLSHYLSYQAAQQRDQATINAITHLQPILNGHQACGAAPLNGFLQFAQQQQWTIDCVDHCNSGDTAGSRERVVGYASFICT